MNSRVEGAINVPNKAGEFTATPPPEWTGAIDVKFLFPGRIPKSIELIDLLECDNRCQVC